MDDFVLSNLYESRNEWCARLISIMTPLFIQGIRSVLNESVILCVENNEPSKYLMTFQNLLGRIHKWNGIIIEDERKRIVEKSGCNNLEDLIMCVHVIQIKVLTCIRAGNKQKKIDISIPKLDVFIHRVYIHIARKIYQNVYLFDRRATQLQVQKNNREIEMIIQECILTTIRDSIPTEQIIRAYLDETVEHEDEITVEDVKEPVAAGVPDTEESSVEVEPISSGGESSHEMTREEAGIPEIVPSIRNIDNDAVVTRLSFNDYDSVLDAANKVENINAPKTLERLEEISTSRAIQRRLEEEEEDNQDGSERLNIHSDADIEIDSLDIFDMGVDKSSGLSRHSDDDVSLMGVENI
jgi:hypothetical protein